MPPAGLAFGVQGRQVGKGFRPARRRQAGDIAYAGIADAAPAAAAVTVAAAAANATAEDVSRQHLASKGRLDALRPPAARFFRIQGLQAGDEFCLARWRQAGECRHTSTSVNAAAAAGTAAATATANG